MQVQVLADLAKRELAKMDKEEAIKTAVAAADAEAKAQFDRLDPKRRVQRVPKEVQVQMPGDDAYEVWHKSDDEGDEVESDEEEMPSAKTRAAPTDMEDETAKKK